MPVDRFDPTMAAAAVTKKGKDEPVGKPPIHHAAIPKKSKTVTVAPNTTAAFPPPGDPYWKANPLVTEHKDGTLRQWGEDTTATKNPNTLPKQLLPQQVQKPPIGTGREGHGDFGRYDTEGNRTTPTPNTIPSNNK